MKVHEASKILKKTNKELLAEINDPRIKSHLSKIPADILAELGLEKKTTEAPAEPTQTVDSAETVIIGESNESELDSIQDDVEVDCKATDVPDGVSGDVLQDSVGHVQEPEGCPYSPEQIELGIRCLGNKSAQWKWRHIIGRV